MGLCGMLPFFPQKKQYKRKKEIRKGGSFPRPAASASGVSAGQRRQEGNDVA